VSLDTADHLLTRAVDAEYAATILRHGCRASFLRSSHRQTTGAARYVIHGRFPKVIELLFLQSIKT
jgi:hypothetical protein